MEQVNNETATGCKQQVDENCKLTKQQVGSIKLMKRQADKNSI
jgi:hypothetical protein